MTTIDFFREVAKRTGEPMDIGCPDCGGWDWKITVLNIGDNVVIDSLKCSNCGEVATVDGGVIDE